MKRKKCIDCEKTLDIKLFGVQRKYLSTKGKGISIYLYPCCKDCQYKRNRKSLLRSKDNILKQKEYQKIYHKKWHNNNRQYRNKYMKNYNRKRSQKKMKKNQDIRSKVKSSPIIINLSNKTNKVIKGVEIISPDLIFNILNGKAINENINYSIGNGNIPLHLFAMDLIKNEYEIGLMYLVCKSKTTILSGFNHITTEINGNKVDFKIKSKFVKNQKQKDIVEIYDIFKISYRTIFVLNKLSPKTSISISLHPIN